MYEYVVEMLNAPVESSEQRARLDALKDQLLKDDGTLTREIFKSFLESLAEHWENDFNTVDEVVASVSAGNRLPFLDGGLAALAAAASVDEHQSNK